MDKTFEEAMDFRHACKKFDTNKKIECKDMKYIVSAGIKSPSSFGMEPWKFLMITDEKIKKALKPLCWNQDQIDTCSNLVVMLALIEDIKPSSGVPLKMFSRKGLSEDLTKAYVKKYEDKLAPILDDDEKIFNYSSAQVHIAAANMMTAAAIKGIDSCPIGGFDKLDVEKLLKIDKKKYGVALIVPFGYRINPQSKQLRKTFEEVVTHIKSI